jgi:lipopolysaccharide export system protein LptC
MSQSSNAVATRVRFDPTRPRSADIYERAFRHSRRVGILKIALPAVALIAVGGFFLTMRFADLTGSTAIAVGGLNITTKSLIMDAPHMSGFDSSGHPYKVTATKAVQDLVHPKLVNLETIDAHFATDDTNTAVLKARAGILDNLRNRLGLRNGITIVTSDGYHVTMIDADMDIGKGTMVSNKPVEIRSSDGSWLKANGVSIEDKGAKITFRDGVTVNYIPSDTDSRPPATTGEQAGANNPADRFKSATE